MELEGKNFTNEEQWIEWLREAVLHVNRLLYNESTVDEELKGMGTTLEVALIRGESCLISHTGDSRVYSVSKEEISQITRDHSYVNVLLESGEITEEEAVTHPKRNWIMRAIGSEKSIEADLYSLKLSVDNYLLLCTDGLSNKVNEEQLKEIISSTTDLRSKAERLVDLANSLGGEDNISVILIDPAGSEVTSI
jgi:protein phosphatase